MLVLGRKQGETVVIGDDIQLTVVEIRGNIVRLGLTAPRHVSIYREELGSKAKDVNNLAGGETTVEADP